MIALQKTAKPQVLVNNAATWTQDLVQALASGQKPSKTVRNRYNHPQIKQALRAETHGKCAYCESKFGHVTYGDIEHVQPKGADPTLAFEWDNLTISCDVCNTNKAEYDDIIDPYNDDPQQHLLFEGTILAALPGSDLGGNTIDTLELNRPELLGERKSRRDFLYALADNIAKTVDDRRRAALLEVFLDEKSESSEYAALSRALISVYVEKLKHQGLA